MKKWNFIVLLVALISQSCVMMTYHSSQKIPVKMNREASHGLEMQVTDTKYFYLWGTRPVEHKVWVDREFLEGWGVPQVSGLEIVEGQTFLDSLFSFASFGLVVPRTYYLKGYAP